MAQRGFLAQIQSVFIDQGLVAAIGAFTAAAIALVIATVRRAFTNEAAVKRIETSFRDMIEKWEEVRKEDRDEVRADIRAIHKRLDTLFDQRGIGQ